MVTIHPKQLLIGLFVLVLPTIVHTQKRSTILGDAWIGIVVNANESTREITLRHPDKNRDETFVGIVQDGCKLKMRDGSSRELLMSEIKPDTRIRAFYKTKTQDVGGQKRKVNIIHKVEFLGIDEYTILREALELEPTIGVISAESQKFQTSDPLKIYLAFGLPHLKERFVKWVGRWNEQQGEKHGHIEVVPDRASSEVSIVCFWGSDESVAILPALLYDSTGGRHDIFPATAYIVTTGSDGIKILWTQRLWMSQEKPDLPEGIFEKEIEKRMKVRFKK